jgi:hypothetical protein
LELLQKISLDKKVKTLKYIFENCEKINHTAFLLSEFQNGYGKDKQLMFEPQDELEIVAKDFIIKVQSLPTEELFENVDDDKNDLMFSFIETYGSLNKLKNDLADFIKQKAMNGLLVMKSLIPMTYINFSTKGEYSDEIRVDRFKVIEYYVSRDILEGISYELFPELKNNLPEGYLRAIEMSKDKLIIVQYLRYTINDAQQKQ